MQHRTVATRFQPARKGLARGLFALLALASLGSVPTRAHAGVSISVSIAPPPLPVYEQPPVPGPGYLWTPGYWAWSDAIGYYWVPGTWVLAPFAGALWTPGYWGWNDGVYLFHAGYWGLHVGFYGGIAYGYGYDGLGYQGGYWGHGGFYYNRTVNRVTNNITNVYNTTVINKTVNVTRVSYNGGPHGVMATPSPQQARYAHERRVAPLPAQLQQRELASHVQSLRASVNHGMPAVAATPRVGAFAARDVSHAQPRPAPAWAGRPSALDHGARAPQRDIALQSSNFAPHAQRPPAPARSDAARTDHRAPEAAYARPYQGEGGRARDVHHAPADTYRGATYPQERHASSPDAPEPYMRQGGQPSYAHVQAPREHGPAMPRPVHEQRPPNHEKRPEYDHGH